MTASALPLPAQTGLEDLVTALLPQGFARIVQPIAVDLYHRQGDVTKFTDNQEIFAKVVGRGRSICQDMEDNS